MTKSQILTGLALALLLPTGTLHAAEKPNIIYNLAEDIGETQDLAAGEPEKAREMEKLLNEARHPSELFPNKLLDR